MDQALFVGRDDGTVRWAPDTFGSGGGGEFDVVDVQALFCDVT